MSSSSRWRASASCATRSDERERDHGLRRLGQVAGQRGQGGAAARGHPRDDAALARRARQPLLPGAALARGPAPVLPLRAVRRRGRLPRPSGHRALHPPGQAGGDPRAARGPRPRVLRDDRRPRGRAGRRMSRFVDLSPTVPHGFEGPPSTDFGVQLDVRVKPGYWQSAQASLSCHTGTHVESALHVIEGGEPIDAIALDRVIGLAVVLDLTPVPERTLVDVDALERAVDRLAAGGAQPRRDDILLLRTDWAQRAIGTPRYFGRSPALTEGAAAWLVAREPR